MKSMSTVSKTLTTRIVRHKRAFIISVLILAAAGGYYYHLKTTTTASRTQSFYAITPVATGDVSSGIETTGTINAEQELDLNIYKQLKRITAVNVQNGQHVTKGTTLISFDKSDANVTANQSQASLTSAQLALQNAQQNVNDPNTQIANLQTQVAAAGQTIAQNEQAITTAYRTFLNNDLEVIMDPARATAQQFTTVPTVSGTYMATVTGEYDLTVYASGAASGYSFYYSGIENGSNAIIAGTPVDLGTYGLKITFPKDLHTGDRWIVKVPNTDSPSYALAKQTYDTAVANAQNAIAAASSSIASDQQQIKNLEQTDTVSYRDLSVTQAQNAVASAQQNLSQAYTTISDRDVVAPFDGTIEGMQNVVVGATPVGGTSDTIALGTLISDKFITSFTLSAAEVDKVTVGQKVKVTVTSLTDKPTYDATITEISSLSAGSGVAQYTVTAELDYDRTTAPVILRDGMQADIEVVQQDNPNALRIPASAVAYINGQPTVKVVSDLTDAEKKEADSRGIIKATAGTTLTTYPVTVQLGIKGSYWYEVTSGLSAGDYVLTSQLTTTSAATQSVVGSGFGGGPGEFRTRTTSSGNSGTTNRSVSGNGG